MLQLVQRVVAGFKGRSVLVAEQRCQSAGRIFHRPELARRLAADLMSDFYDSGMFLTAPRRTGKSTFIQHDLKPALEAGHGALVLYVDLWERRKEDQLPQVTDDSIQAALDRLCEAKLVWCGDGPYALEESQFARWLLERSPVEVERSASQRAQHGALSVAGCDEAAA